ncbi:uncharacterized protein LOC124266878 [Haliotis rubra]|uniref:uncharacterized protein LOC124266878 n=1 Tax=Haliotis rubra TaxID=36100 RepID=UPI001EE5F056|nr:uncharacterized protein LOC124266878 [Haliotis rubra]
MADNVRQQLHCLADLKRSLVSFSEDAATLFNNVSLEAVVNDSEGNRTRAEYADLLVNYLKDVSGSLRQRFDNATFWSTNSLKWGLETTLANDAVQPKNEFYRIRLMKGSLQIHFETIRRDLDKVYFWIQTINKRSRDGSPTNHLKAGSLSQLHYNNAVDDIRRIERLIQMLLTYVVQFQNMPSVSHLIKLKQPLYTFLQPSFYQDNVLNVNIYFEDLSVEERVKSEAYSVEGLVCDIGGSIGLCLGGSILTFIEVADLILFSRKRRKDDSDPSKPGTAMEDLPQKQDPSCT